MYKSLRKETKGNLLAESVMDKFTIDYGIDS